MITLTEMAGNDIYLFNKGDGHDQIYDSRYADSLDIIEFGSSIKLGRSDFNSRWRSPNNQIQKQ